MKDWYTPGPEMKEATMEEEKIRNSCEKPTRARGGQLPKRLDWLLTGRFGKFFETKSGWIMTAEAQGGNRIEKALIR